MRPKPDIAVSWLCVLPLFSVCLAVAGLIPVFHAQTNVAVLEGVTDEGLRSLASAGCGKKLTSLTLDCECFSSTWDFDCFHPCLCLSYVNYAALDEEVTDEGLRALASSGCGAGLTLLHLKSEFFGSFRLFPECHALWPHSTPACPSKTNDSALEKGVTDEGLLALVQAGCGARLSSLTLDCQWFSLLSVCHATIAAHASFVNKRRSAGRGSDRQNTARIGSGQVWRQADIADSFK